MYNKTRIALSLGHGVRYRNSRLVVDSGAVNTSYSITESDAVGQVGDIILETTRKFTNIQVLRVPRADLSYRIDVINLWHSIKPIDFAVELHFNGFWLSSVSGCETLYKQGDPRSKELAQTFQRVLNEGLENRDRGIKPRHNMAFLNGCNMPAIMLEPDFITNDIVASRLKETRWYNFLVADLIIDAMCQSVK